MTGAAVSAVRDQVLVKLKLDLVQEPLIGFADTCVL